MTGESWRYYCLGVAMERFATEIPKEAVAVDHGWTGTVVERAPEIALVSCVHGMVGEPLSVPAWEVAMGASEEAVVRRACELWASRDADAMVELFAKDGVYDNVPMREPFHGREALRAWLEEVFEHLWVEIDVLHIASSGDWVLSERLDTHVLGDRRLPLPVMNTSRVVDGKIVLWRDYYDQKTVADLGIA